MSDRLTEALDNPFPDTKSLEMIYEAARWAASYPTDDDVKRAADQWRAEFPCICGPEYSERGLVSPHCNHHEAEDAARAMLEAVKREALS